MKEKYHISGMTCSACSSHVEKAVSKLSGAENVQVNLLTETMEITYDESTLKDTDIIMAVENAGYGATKLGDNKEKKKEDVQKTFKDESRQMKWRLGLSIAFLIPLMYVAMYHMYHMWFHIPVPQFMMRCFHGPENGVTYALVQFLLVLPILYMNRKFFEVGFKTLFHLAPNMDSLVAVGAGASLVYGVFALLRMSYGLGHGDLVLVEQYAGNLYFESAGMILTLITVGKYLESHAKGKTGQAVMALMDLAPKMALVIDEQGRENEIPVENLQVGQVFAVKPGGYIPVDGIVVEGQSGVDESAITGESMPVEKQVGDKVISGTLNKSGYLKCRAQKVGEDTTLATIIRLVEEAGGSKAPIAKLADKVAGVFVPVVMSIALLTLIGWLIAGATVEFAISCAISVLVISCPCALGLATPVAIMVGTGVGAKKGILIKSGEALQSVCNVDTVILDKTGTITEGNLKVLEVACFEPGVTTEGLIGLAASLEEKSEHPLAEAVCKEAEIGFCKKTKIHDFQAVFGKGICGTLAEKYAFENTQEMKQDGPTATIGEKKKQDVLLPAGSKIFIGNKGYLAEQGITLSENCLELEKDQGNQGMTTLWVGVASELSGSNANAGGNKQSYVLGLIGVADEIKKSSAKAISSLQKMGIQVIMLTGDNERTAKAVQERVGVEQVIAGVLPDEKEKHVRKRMEEGHKVAMVGDGINDAPALVTANVGIAIGAGTDVALESADIVLMKNDLLDVVCALALSRKVIKNIKENLFWAFFYNSLGIPLAAGLLFPTFGLRLTPMFGAFAMSMSSLFVVCNALRLRGFRSPVQEVQYKNHFMASEEIFAEGRSEEQQKKESMEIGNQKAEVEQERMEEKLSSEKEIKTQNESEEKMMVKKMTIEGMMCGHCTGRVQKALEAIEGVESVVMSLEEKSATVTAKDTVSDEVLKAAVTDAGYEVVGIC